MCLRFTVTHRPTFFMNPQSPAQVAGIIDIYGPTITSQNPMVIS